MCLGVVAALNFGFAVAATLDRDPRFRTEIESRGQNALQLALVAVPRDLRAACDDPQNRRAAQCHSWA